MNRTQKDAAIQFLNGKFSKAAACVVTDFTGMSVESMTKLRRVLRELEVEYFVSKNTLTRRAVQGTPFKEMGKHLTGVNAVGISYTDPIPLAKGIHEVAKEDSKLAIKFGFLARSEQFLTPEEVKILATLPSREELLSKLAYLLKSQHTKFVVVLNELMTKFVRSVDAVRAKKETPDS